MFVLLQLHLSHRCSWQGTEQRTRQDRELQPHFSHKHIPPDRRDQRNSPQVTASTLQANAEGKGKTNPCSNHAVAAQQCAASPQPGGVGWKMEGGDALPSPLVTGALGGGKAVKAGHQGCFMLPCRPLALPALDQKRCRRRIRRARPDSTRTGADAKQAPLIYGKAADSL